MSYQEIKNLKREVEEILRDQPDTRNSDITLTLAVWRKFFPHYIIKVEGGEYIMLDKLFQLPREDHIKRVRASLQNDEGKYPPTDWKVAKARDWEQDEWRVAMGFPTVESAGTSHPSWTPPSMTAQGGAAGSSCTCGILQGHKHEKGQIIFNGQTSFP